ncbi:MAG: 1-acyl-sn-glycerol-3-phosphate acyltransferase [Chthonomonadales bacterium]|nr:1-acyl-sn-glycerol-3-phosphate acyltransferase [Chthonomonadales bacterium]
MSLFYRMSRGLVRCLLRLLGPTTVIGHDRIPESGGVIIACNHVSLLDPPLVGCSVRRECAFMARHDLWKFRPFGALISRLNAFPVRRNTADRGAIKEAIRRLDEGQVLVLFPEGTRSHDGRLQPAEPGLTMILQRSKAPVIPCALVGPEKMLPHGRRIPNPTRLKVVFGKPYYPSAQATREEVLFAVMDSIARLLIEHRPELPPGHGYRLDGA